MSEESGNALKRHFWLRVSHEGTIIWRLDWVQRIGLQVAHSWDWCVGAHCRWAALVPLHVDFPEDWLCMPMTWQVVSPRVSKERAKWKRYPFYNLALEVMEPSFFLILFSTSESPSSAQTPGLIFRRGRWQRMCGYILKHSILKQGNNPNWGSKNKFIGIPTRISKKYIFNPASSLLFIENSVNVYRTVFLETA